MAATRPVLALVAAFALALALFAPRADDARPPTPSGDAPLADTPAEPARAPAAIHTHQPPPPTPRTPEPRPATRAPLALEQLTVAGRARSVVAGELIFAFAPGTPAGTARARLARAGLTLVDYLPALGAARATFPPGRTVAEALAAARADTDLPTPAPNTLAYAADALHTLTDAELDACLGGESTGVVGAGDGDGVDPWAEPTADDIAAAQAAEADEQHPDAIADRHEAALDRALYPLVAVIDSGVTYRSAVLPWGAFVRAEGYDDITTLDGYDFVRDHPLALDENQHGTHIASTIVHEADGKVRILPVKVLDRLAMGTEYDVARGMLFALDHGADLINLSLTFGPAYIPSPLMSEVLDRAEDRGVLILAAAGNEGASTVAYPAALDGLIAVGAEHPDHTPFSNRGAALDLTAKAGHLPTEDKGLEAETFEIYRPAHPAKVRLTGTSMATASASGEIARLIRELDDHDDLPARGTPARLDIIRHIVTQTAKPEGDADFDPLYGVGKIDRKKAKELGKDIADDDTSPTAPVRRGAAAQVSLFLRDTGATTLRAVALVELQGPDGRPLADATLFGDWQGSARGLARCTTDPWGRCLVESPDIHLATPDAPVLVGLAVHRGTAPGIGRLAIRPADRYHAPRAAALGDLSRQLEHHTPAAELDAATLALLDETDPATGAPLYCLGDACPGYTPDHGAPDDLFQITHRRIYLATRFGGGTPPAESLLAGLELIPSYQYRRHGRALQGGGLVLAFNDAFAAQAADAFGDALHLVDDGLRLGSSGPGEPLSWVNDLTVDVITEGTGMMPSGVSFIGYDFRLWSAQLFYAIDVGGAGMMPSGVSLTFTHSLDFFTYNLANLGGTFITFGSALTDSTHAPFAFFELDHVAP